MPEPNIVLTGFMGTGKTSIGREVGTRLGRPFVDLDDVIAEHAGKTVPEIFAQDGEHAFRALEAAVCEEMREPSGRVIAAGGGAVLSPDNRAALAAGGVVICLDAEPDTIVKRLAGSDGRPLLAGPDRQARIAALLAQRAGAYDAIPLHLNTSHLAIAAAAERIMAMAFGLPEGSHYLPVRFGGEIAYPVLIGEGVLAQAGERLASAGVAPGRCAIVTNPIVAARYAGPLATSLRAAGFEPGIFEVPDGEAFKTLESAAALYGQFAEARLARNETVIALGGGVIGDLAGFVAATWLRGVPFVQVPTTLLSMVDASIGGKVAVDLPQGKNLVGAFKQPVLVLSDPQVLASLPGTEFRAGLAEVLKSAIIGAPALFEQLAGDGPSSLVSMIAQTVGVKVALVERDPFESGDRAWLNLGHTFGHALELYSNFQLRHGEAVALGTVAAAQLAAGQGYCEPGLVRRVQAVTRRLGLPCSYAFDVDRVHEMMATDKKRAGRALRFVLPRRIGEVTLVKDVPVEAVKAALRTIQGQS